MYSAIFSESVWFRKRNIEMAPCSKPKHAPSSQQKDTAAQKTGYAVSQWEKELDKVFGEQLSLKPAIEVPMKGLPPVCSKPKEQSKARKVYLRSAAQTLTSNTIELNQFDPNFFSRGNIWCRSPGCKQKKPRCVGTKEDLYLCPNHRKSLEENVAKMCQQKGVDVSVKHRSEDLEGYTSMIGMLESAFNSLSKPKAHAWPEFGKKSGIAQEIYLNMRNFLIIVNVLLNPEPENCAAALNQPMRILLDVLRILRDDGEVTIQRLRELLDVLRVVVEQIFFAFGIIYSWIYLSLIGNPGAQLGAGIGGFVGLAGMVGGPAVGTLTAMGGAFFGGLIGSGVYNIWYAPQANIEGDDERIRRYQEFAQANNRVVQADPQNQLQAGQGPPPEECGVYFLTGSATGDLVLLFMFCYSIGIPVI